MCCPLDTHGEEFGGADGRGRFDNLTRVLAFDLSRRRAVTAAVGVLVGGFLRGARPSAVRGQEVGSVPLGSPCTATSQCAPSGPPELSYPSPICGDNWVGDDGPLNCCSSEGGLCQADAHCCADLLCSFSQSFGSFPTCRRPLAAQTVPPNAACTTPAQCLQTNGAVRACADNGIADDGSLNCCVVDGGACGSDADCCGAGTCGAAPFNSCSGGLTIDERTTVGDVNLRYEPSFEVPVIVVVPTGTGVRVLSSGFTNGFVQTFSNDGYVGWRCAARSSIRQLLVRMGSVRGR